MDAEKLAKAQSHVNAIAALLYEETDPKQVQTNPQATAFSMRLQERFQLLRVHLAPVVQRIEGIAEGPLALGA